MKFIIPSSQLSSRGYTGSTMSIRPSIHLSVCGQNRVRSVSSTILAISISYLHILSSSFRRCVLCIKCFFFVFFFFSKLKKKCDFSKFFEFVTLFYFDLGSSMSWSIVWVIMGWRGYPQNASVLVVLIAVWLKYHWDLFQNVQLTTCQHWFG